MERIDYNNAVSFQHVLWDAVLRDARFILDATCGNGHDTAYLAAHAHEEGHIYAIDIQENAIEQTRLAIEKLRKTNSGEHNQRLPKVTIHLMNHANLDRLAPEITFDLIVFNLGYLPGANHSIMTRGATTIEALEICLKRLSPKGLITLVAYPGTPEGFTEMEKVQTYLEGVNQKYFNVSQWRPINQINHPPVLFIVKGR